MKLIYAIVRNDNEDDVMDALMHANFQVTKLATTGGFLKKGNSLNFNYKFVIASGSSASRWESDPNRQFNGASLKKLADSVASGSYETCTYKKVGSVITMTCFWR